MVTEKETVKTLVAVEDLKPGMVILPPAREISLWMRKLLQEKAWPESAMYLTITAVEEGRSDTRGRWILVKADHTEQWNDGQAPYPFSFKARPDTLWPVIDLGQPDTFALVAAAKLANPGILIATRIGDFYEWYDEQATEVAKILNITLTGRLDCKSDRRPMCGVPYHSVEKYLAPLLAAGLKVALCEVPGSEPASPWKPKAAASVDDGGENNYSVDRKLLNK